MRWLLIVAIATRALFTGTVPDAGPRIVGDLVGLYNGSVNGTLYAIGAVERTGGVWTPYSGNPVLQVGAGGTWDDATVKDPWLMRMPDGTYVMYYSGLDSTNYRIGRATASAVTGPWTKYASNPVLDLGSSGTLDDAGVIFPTVLYDPDASPAWKMWYGANDGSTLTVGYAHSADGLSWTKHGQVLGLGAGGTWNDVYMLPFGVVKVGATYYLFVGGAQDTGDNPKWQGGLWTFTSPTGTYTADAGNPVLDARFGTAGVFQSLTANTPTSSAIVTMTSTAAFNVGEPVVLYDSDSAPFVAHIQSIDTGTQITLDAASPRDFTTGQGAVFRPMTGNSVVPRSVWRSGPTWHMAVTPFQALNDLTTTQLVEGLMLASASAPEGPWTFDYDTGLIVPLGSGWDANSAENLSVLPAT